MPRPTSARPPTWPSAQSRSPRAATAACPPRSAGSAFLPAAAQRPAPDPAPLLLTMQILEKSDCEQLKMGLYLGVAEASQQPPKFIHLTYRPSGPVKRKIAIVGKGLTFDSGGYNLKAGAGSMIELMKAGGWEGGRGRGVSPADRSDPPSVRSLTWAGLLPPSALPRPSPPSSPPT